MSDDGAADAEGGGMTTAEERAEALDALATLAGVLARLLAVLGRVGGRLAVFVLSWLLAGFREILFGETRDDANRWLEVAGDRRHVVVAFVATVFAGTLLLGLIGVIGVRESGFVTTMFSTIIAGLFSFVPIVIGVNQVALSWLSGSPGRLRDRIESVESFRAEAVDLHDDADGVSTDPVQFLDALLAESLARVDAVAATADRTGAAAVNDRATRLRDRLKAIRRDPDASGLFDLLLPLLDTELAGASAEASRLAAGDVDPDLAAALEDLATVLVTLDTARQYLQTVYIQRSLARLSRQLAYTGMVALVASSLVVMIYASGYPPVVHALPLLTLVSAALAGAFAPFAVLFAHVVRLSTVIQRTAAPGAFRPASR